MCNSDVFAPASEKCTYENRLFLENICARRLSEAVFDENAHIKTDFSRVSYVHTTGTYNKKGTASSRALGFHKRNELLLDEK